MINIHPFALAGLIVVLIFALITDIRSHKIPNWLTYPTIFLAILLYLDVDGLRGMLFSAEGLGLGIVLLMPFYMLGGMAAGDVKLMGVVGAVLGPGHLCYAFLSTAIAGGIYALILLLSHPVRRKELASELYSALRALVLTKEPRFPRTYAHGEGFKLYYGVAICTGTLAYILFEVYRGNIPALLF
ncbi:MAG: prepilin peptidase [Syntrophobacteraceae bacterium]